MNLEASVHHLISAEELIEAGDAVLVAASGGVDSSALLHLLNAIKETVPFSIAVAHVNHQLRGEESLRDEVFVEEICHSLNVPFHTVQADINRYASEFGLSTQHAGRDLRYNFFEELCAMYNYQKIAVAHHLDDRIETFLLRLIKGTGLHGLSSIPMKREKIIRPFLHTTKAEIEAYAKAQGIGYVEDSSNRKDKYERNFVRNRIMPLMVELNPQFRQKVYSLLGDLAAVNGFFQNEADRFLTDEVHDDGPNVTTHVDAIKGLQGEVRFRVLSVILSRLHPLFIPLREHIHLVEKVIFSPRPNTLISLPHTILVKRSYNTLVLTKQPVEAVNQDIFPITVGDNRIEPLGIILSVSENTGCPAILAREKNMVAFFDADRTADLTVRTFRNGDRFVPLGMRESVKLKDFFISRKIPKGRRRSIPLLLSGSDIIWIVGERIDERYKIGPETKRILKVSAEFVC